MKERNHFRAFLRALNHYVTFFLLVAFVVTCCTMLFVSILSESLGIDLTSENIGVAAKLTFANVVIVSLLFTVIDALRRKWAIDRPVKSILEACDKMIEGDFSVRIAHVSKFAADDKFNDIIDCINKMATELSGVETLRTDFISNVSHEMKTPLAVIQNYCKLLENPDISEEKRIEYAKAITDATKRLSSMMTNILKLNRLENQQIYPKSEKFDLSDAVCQTLLSYENVWEEKNITLETDIEENISAVADKELLCLVFSNLFSNAFKFTDNEGTVKVSLKSDAEFATVTVSDTGCGISPEIGTKIFDKFYQADSSHATEGNGLGLALVKRVVDIVQADISVESVVNKGSTFTLKIRRGTDEEAISTDKAATDR